MGTTHPTATMVHSAIDNAAEAHIMYPLSWMQIDMLLRCYHAECINKIPKKARSSHGIEQTILGSSRGTHINLIHAFRFRDLLLCNDDDNDKPFILFAEFYFLAQFMLKNTTRNVEVTYIEGAEFRWVTHVFAVA